MVEEVFQHQEQMVRLAEHCLKYEEDDGKAGFHVKLFMSKISPSLKEAAYENDS